MGKNSILALILFLFLAGGCDDDTTTPGTTAFSVNLTVTDPAGEAVPGLEAKLHVFLPADAMPFAGKPLAVIPFSLPISSVVSVIIYDMDGNVVKTLVDRPLEVGLHEVSFNYDDEGNRVLGTRLYRCEMIATVDGVEQYRNEIFLTLYAAIDRDQRPVMGITDEQGKINFAERVEFPYLYNPGPQMKVNENGELKGTFEFIDKVEITLTDPATGLFLEQEVIIGQGRNVVKMVWDQSLTGKPRDLAVPPGANNAANSVNAGPVPERKYSLGPSRPNPYN